MCHQRISYPSEANIKWKEQIQYSQQSNEYAEFSGIDREPIEFEWNIFRGFTSIEILRRIQKDLDTRRKNPHRFERRIPVMSMFNDIAWRKSGNSSECVSNVREVSDHAKECQRGHWSFRGLGDDKKWHGTCIFKPERKWDQQANRMIDVCAQTGHPPFPFISVLS